MPKYQQIFEQLRAEIADKTIKANSYLPSENELMKKYDASRDTIRKALNLLSTNGYIQKEKGKGSLVLDTSTINFPVSGVTSYKELEKSNLVHETKTHVIEFKRMPADEEIKNLLYMQGGDVYKVVRVREIEKEKIILDTDYLKADVVEGLKKEHAQNSLYEYIEKDLGLSVSFARKEITVIPATKEEKQLLDMKDYDLLVCVRSFTYLEDATLFEYTVSKHRPDKFRFVDFARRDKTQKM
ncbi:trehalose operon repressor [Amedibacterium intestinale]|jgi:trehalose operon repressor|uniref:trehalose operon repressor n=1 Tax=Amedibacterium intestinale TaxID=2583452 RepID=UPI001373ED34|nr:trehalose operon repressor [Amedibacterium intestinale]BBK62441.1 trehalose operon repressor [Amedibacterium intestinale]